MHRRDINQTIRLAFQRSPPTDTIFDRWGEDFVRSGLMEETERSDPQTLGALTLKEAFHEKYDEAIHAASVVPPEWIDELELEPTLSPLEAAEQLHIGRETVVDLIKEKILPASKNSRGWWRIRPEEVQRLLDDGVQLTHRKAHCNRPKPVRPKPGPRARSAPKRRLPTRLKRLPTKQGETYQMLKERVLREQERLNAETNLDLYRFKSWEAKNAE